MLISIFNHEPHSARAMVTLNGVFLKNPSTRTLLEWCMAPVTASTIPWATIASTAWTCTTMHHGGPLLAKSTMSARVS